MEEGGKASSTVEGIRGGTGQEGRFDDNGVRCGRWAAGNMGASRQTSEEDRVAGDG